MDSPSVNINNLPDEILLIIFSFLSVKDLAFNVQQVCLRWSQLCMDEQLWKDSLVRTDSNPDSISSLLEKVPKLQGFFMDEYSYELFEKLAVCCKDLRKITVSMFSCTQKDWEEALRQVLLGCTKLEEITIDSSALIINKLASVVGQYGANVRAFSVSCGPSDPVILKHIADGCPFLLHLDMNTMDWLYPDVEYFLQQKKNKLVSLRIKHSSKEGSPIIPLLTTYQNKLRTLDLICCDRNHSAEDLSALKELSHLTSLAISMCGGQTSDAVASVFKKQAMSQLVALCIRGSDEVNTALVNTICNNCPNLLRLRISATHNLNDDGLRYLYKCANLEELVLEFCTSLTGAAIDYIAMCAKLKYLKIDSYGEISKSLGKLTALSELRNLEIGIAYSEHFPYPLKNLRQVTLLRRKIIDQDAITHLCAKLPYVRVHIS